MTSGSRAPNPIALLDESISLLRSAPVSAWVGWAAGSLPFGLGVIAFTTEMTASASAADVLPAHSLVLAMLFLWMVCRQTIFSQQLRALLNGERTVPRVSLPAVARTQLLLWSTSLLLIPLCALSIAGLPWAVTFYYSAAAFPVNGAPPGTREVMRYASAKAATWPFASVIELGIVTLLWMVALVNAAILLIGMPIIARSITGQESIFSRNPEGMFNGTLLAGALVIAALAMDPVLRALYVIRAFRVDAIRTGVDLRAALAGCAIVATMALLVFAPVCHAATAESINPAALERSIHEVIRRPEFVWREARPPETNRSANAFLAFTEDTGRFLARQVERATEWLGDGIRSIVRWLKASSAGPQASNDRGGAGPALALPVLYVLIAGAAGAAIALALRLRFAMRNTPAAEAASVPMAMDLNREDVSPDEAAEDEWMAMASGFLASGDLRLATRALYLAVLASLGRSGLLSIHRARSNMDYRRELGRRARGNITLQQRFAEMVSVFEQTWYGRGAISAEQFERLRSNALALRTHGRP